MRIESLFCQRFGWDTFWFFCTETLPAKKLLTNELWHQMHHVGRDELAHARWKSRQLLAVVSLSFGVGETNCSQGAAKQKQHGGGREFESRRQTLTKQPSTQISQIYFISFGFYLSSFAFYEAAFFQWLLFDHICLNKVCHNLRRVFNLSMYITNIIPDDRKCFGRC